MNSPIYRVWNILLNLKNILSLVNLEFKDDLKISILEFRRNWSKQKNLYLYSCEIYLSVCVIN
jgi:hypothetical protein